MANDVETTELQPNWTITAGDVDTTTSQDEIDGGVMKTKTQFSPDDEICVTIKSTDFKIDAKFSEGSWQDEEAHTTIKPDVESGHLKEMRPDSIPKDDEDMYGTPIGSQEDGAEQVETPQVSDQAAIVKDESKDLEIDCNNKDLEIDCNNNDETDGLQCPRCLMFFDVHQHFELIEHVNICMN